MLQAAGSDDAVPGDNCAASTGSDVASSAATKLEQAASALTGEAKGYGELYVKVLKRGLEKVGLNDKSHWETKHVLL